MMAAACMFACFMFSAKLTNDMHKGAMDLRLLLNFQVFFWAGMILWGWSVLRPIWKAGHG